MIKELIAETTFFGLLIIEWAAIVCGAAFFTTVIFYIGGK